MHLLKFSLENMLHIFKNSPASAKPAPRTSDEAGHNLEAPKIFPAYATALRKFYKFLEKIQLKLNYYLFWEMYLLKLKPSKMESFFYKNFFPISVGSGWNPNPMRTQRGKHGRIFKNLTWEDRKIAYLHHLFRIFRKSEEIKESRYKHSAYRRRIKAY